VFGADSVFAAPAVYDPSRLAWAAALLAWVLAVPMYAVTTVVATVAHEGGHALVGTLLLQKVRAVRLQPDGGGVTEFGPIPWLFNIFVSLAGYIGPSVFGLLAAALLLRGATEAVLWASLGFLFLMLFMVRGWFGLSLVPALMVVIFATATQVEPPLQVFFTYVWVWFLLIAPVEDMLVHIRQKIYESSGSDTRTMQRLTLVPSELWSLIFLTGTIAALVYGGSLLLRPAG